MPELEARRPLSPHLQIYRMMLTLVMSGLHRITGTVLYAGTILLVYYLVAAANGPASFGTASWLFGSIIGQLVLLGFTWALLNHLLGGIRHAIWDSGYGLDHPWREYLALATAIGGVALTILVWAGAYLAR
jgi:succinate dehydrogenase / fumarate reductase, cytochrome b subunit